EVHIRRIRPGLAVFHIAGERALPAIQIDGANTETFPQQKGNEMHGGGGLARPALFISEHNYMCFWTRPLFASHSPATHLNPIESRGSLVAEREGVNIE